MGVGVFLPKVGVGLTSRNNGLSGLQKSPLALPAAIEIKLNLVG